MKIKMEFVLDTDKLSTYSYSEGEEALIRQNLVDWLVELKHLYLEKKTSILSNTDNVNEETRNFLIAFNEDDINLSNQMMETLQINPVQEGAGQ